MAIILLGIAVELKKEPPTKVWVTSTGVRWGLSKGQIWQARHKEAPNEWMLVQRIPLMQLRDAIAWSLGWERGIFEAGGGIVTSHEEKPGS